MNRVDADLAPPGRTLIEPLMAPCRRAEAHLPEVEASRAGSDGVG